MADVPNLEERVAVLETLYLSQHARVVSLEGDVDASFKQQARYQVQLEERIDARFETVNARFDVVDNRLDTIEQNMTAMEQRINARMVAMEDRILGAFNQLAAMVLENNKK